MRSRGGWDCALAATPSHNSNTTLSTHSRVLVAIFRFNYRRVRYRGDCVWESAKGYKSSWLKQWSQVLEIFVFHGRCRGISIALVTVHWAIFQAPRRLQVNLMYTRAWKVAMRACGMKECVFVNFTCKYLFFWSIANLRLELNRPNPRSLVHTPSIFLNIQSNAKTNECFFHKNTITITQTDQ